MAQQQTSSQETQSGMRVFLSVVGFMVGVLVLVLAVKYLFGL